MRVILGSCMERPEVVNVFPFYYLPNSKKLLSSYEEFIDEVERTSNLNEKYLKYANNLIKNVKGEVVFHHPPY